MLQVGRHQVAGYGTDWIREAIRRAAIASDREDFPFTDDIVAGVVHYLETKCPLRLLPLEEFYQRLAHMLRKINCAAIAAKLPRLAPPVTLSLARTAREASDGLELVFFQNLHDEVDQLKELGVEAINFTGIRKSVSILLATEKWNARAKHLARDIVEFVRSHETTGERSTQMFVEPI